MRGMGLVWVAMVAAGNLLAQGDATAPVGPVHLHVDNLTRPLGIDDATPRFSWQLNDSAPGARQTAYRLLVATRTDLLTDGSADVWDSGKVTSAQSLNVKYAGPAVKPSARYWWRVEVSGLNGKAYPASSAEWWETGIHPTDHDESIGLSGSLSRDGWRADWIGWETAEEAAVRKAPAKWIANPDVVPGTAKANSEQIFAYRKSLSVEKPVDRAILFATGEDTVSVWVNGDHVLSAAPYPAYHHLAWQKFERADVTGQVKEGPNTVAIKCMHYIGKYGEDKRKDAPPMMATLLVFYKDGTTSTVVSDGTWQTAVLEPTAQDLAMGPPESHSSGDEGTSPVDGSGWKNVVVWAQEKGPEETPVLNPWITDSVKSLRKTFDAGGAINHPSDKDQSPGTPGIKSARLYATALGTYEMFLNGKRVSSDFMAPGWTDYRERVLYQTYDVTDLVKSGTNVIGALLAPGWYSTPLEWLGQPNNYGDTPPALQGAVAD